MEALFVGMKEKYNAILDIKESKWYNGHAYLPLIDYSLSFFVEENCFIRLKYEHRQSEFSASITIDGGAFGDRHIFEIQANYKGKTMSSFEILSQGWFNLIFSRGLGFRVKCNDDILRDKLIKSLELKEVFRIGVEDAEFDPLFKGGGDMTKVLFNTKKANPILIDSIFNFLITLNRL